MFAKEANGLTVYRFRRKLVLCDAQDKSIEMGTPYFWFDWGEQDPKSPDQIERLLVESQNRQFIQIDFFSKSYLVKDDYELIRSIARGSGSSSSSSSNDRPPADYLDFTISNVRFFFKAIK